MGTEFTTILDPERIKIGTTKRIFLTLALLLDLTFLLPSGAQAAGDPVTCQGYPELRAYLASQTWWDDGETLSGGDTRHVHVETCFPLNNTLYGDVTLDVIVKMHNEQGRYLNEVRIDVASDQEQIRYSTPTGYPRCDTADCTFTVPVTVPTDSLPAGKWEWRVGASTGPEATGSGNVPNLSLATNGWQVCIRSCDGRTPANPRLEGRGWYQDALFLVRGYINARWGWDSSHDAELAAVYIPVSGTWCPPLRTLTGTQDGATEPIDRSFVSVDPDFHHGYPGIVYRDVPGTIQERVCIDTTHLANGPHKLFWEAYTSSIFTGQLWGAQVLPFRVAN